MQLRSFQKGDPVPTICTPMIIDKRNDNWRLIGGFLSSLKSLFKRDNLLMTVEGDQIIPPKIRSLPKENYQYTSIKDSKLVQTMFLKAKT